MKCWSRALHGISGCPLSDAHLSRLRAAATSCLGIRPSGASSMLRLSTASPMEADPGFYQVWVVMMDVRRMCQKLPRLLGQWTQWMQGYQGKLTQGPFSKLIQCLSQLGWSVQAPPLVTDHEGLVLDLVVTPKALVRRRVEHAWLQHVARAHQHRDTMKQLTSLDVQLLRLDKAGMTPLDQARLAALQTGAFLTPASHSKFDNTLTGLCACCHVPDTISHGLRYCPKFQELRAPYASVLESWDQLPVCVTHHLLFPENPHYRDLRVRLQALPDQTAASRSLQSATGRQQLFTDGSCFFNTQPDLSLAGWAVLNASTDTVLSCGVLPGQLQTTPRAELTAIISALRWVLLTRTQATLWVDAKNIVSGVQVLLAGRGLFRDDNLDLWHTVKGLVQQLPGDGVRIVHIPSHLDETLTESPLEDWIARMNNHVDLQAQLVNSNRPLDFLEVHSRAYDHQQWQQRTLRALRAVHFGIAAAQMKAEGQSDMGDSLGPSEPALPPGLHREELLSESLSIGWRTQLQQVQCKLPISFFSDVCQFLIALDDASETIFTVSWLELVFVHELMGGFDFPVCSPVDGSWVADSSLFAFQGRPTIATRLRLLRKAAQLAFRHLGIDFCLCDGIDLSVIGVSFPCGGLRIGINPQFLTQARASLAVQGPFRKVAQLARPLHC